MPDALAILRRGHSALPAGILIPDVMIRACQLEDVPLPVGAAIYEGESAGGKNIWGADGGLSVETLGTYRPRTALTRADYLAYREKMRAGLIKRQGAGPCQCTSAQYQDTADALGGTWDPLANSRSGFRGMGALIRKYGVRNGARRYNGAGPAAETYADRFVGRYQRWVDLGLPLDPAAVAVPTVPAAPASPKGLLEMIERSLAPGRNIDTLVLPVGRASELVGRAAVSIRARGGAAGSVYFQVSADVDGPPPGAGKPWQFDARNGRRAWTWIPDGTEFLEWDFTTGGPGSLLIEPFPK